MNDPQSLLYGHQVTLTGSIQSSTQSGFLVGLLSAKGFIDNRIFFQHIKDKIVAEKVKKEIESSQVKNYRDFVFEIWPKLQFEAHKELRHKKKQLSLLELNNKELINPEIQENFNSIKRAIEFSQSQIDEEMNSNEQLHEISKGQNVTYGTEIFIRHSDSEMFLTGKILASEAETSAFHFELSKDFGRGMSFKIIPRYKLRQMGEPVQFNDQILLFNEKLNCYINFSPDINVDQLALESNKGKNLEVGPELPIIDSNSSRFEAYLAQSQEAIWTFKLHKEIPQKPKNEHYEGIFGGQVIKLLHTEYGGFLSADLCYTTENPESYLRFYSGELKQEIESIYSLWEIENIGKDAAGSSCDIFEKNSQNLTKYRLRHFFTRKVLGLSKKNLPSLLSPEDEKDENAIVYFVPTIEEEKGVIKNNLSYRLMVKDLTICFSDAPEYEISKYYASLKQKKLIKSDFDPLPEHILKTRRIPLKFEKKYSDENSFFVRKIENNELKNLLFLSSGISSLQEFVFILKSKMKNLLNSEKPKFTIKTLFAFLKFLVGIPNGNEFNDFTWTKFFPPNQPQPDIQKLMRECRIIDLIIEIINFTFEGNFEISRLEDVPRDIIAIIQMCYTLLKYSIAEYRPNELYASQWLELLMNQALYPNQKIDLLAEETLTELIDNNKDILELKIKSEIIKNFINALLADKETKYVNLIRALVTCNGEAMIHNQAEVSKEILENDEVKSNVVLPIKISNDFIAQIYFNEKWIDLITFSNDENLRDNHEYHIGMINLMADLCLNKNFIAINYLREIYSFDICYFIVSTERLGYSLRAAFIRLIINLWVEGSGLQVLLMPNLTRKTLNSKFFKDSISLGQEQFEDVTSQPMFSILKSFVKNYLEGVSNEGRTRAFEAEKNNLTLNVLELVQSMISYGLMHTSKEINEILPSLLSILNGAFDVTTKLEESVISNQLSTIKKSGVFDFMRNKIISISSRPVLRSDFTRMTSRYQENEKTQIVMQCKETISQILLNILDIINDMKISKFIFEFLADYDKVSQEIITSREDNEKSQLIQRKSSISNNYKPPLDFSLKWISSISSHSKIDIFGQSSYDLTSILIEMILYESDSLINYAFILLSRIFSQQKELTELLENVQIIEDPKLQKLADRGQILSSKFGAIVEVCETWISSDDNYSTLKGNEMIGYLVEFSKIMLINESIEPEADLDIFDRLEAINDNSGLTIDKMIYSSEIPINIEGQTLMRNFKIYEKVLEFLHFERNFNLSKSSSISSEAISHCYRFLTLFVFRNEKNQDILANNLPFINNMVSEKPESMAFTSALEILRQNKIVYQNPKIIKETLYNLLKLLIKLPYDSQARLYIVNNLKLLMKCKSRVIKANQILVINALGASEYSNSIITLNSFKEKETIFSALKKLESSIRTTSPQYIVDIPLEIQNLGVSLQVLAVAAEQKNATAENRCQALIPLETIVDFLKKTEGQYTVRTFIIFFLYHAYLETENDLSNFLPLFTEIFEILIKDLERLTIELNSYGEVILRNWKDKFTYKDLKNEYFSFYLLPAIEIMITNELINTSEANLISYANRILEILLKEPEEEESNDHQRRMGKLFMAMKNSPYFNTIVDLEKKGGHLASSVVPLKRLESLKTVATTIFKSSMHMLDAEEDEVLTKSKAFQLLIKNFKQSEEFHDNTEHDFELFVKTFINIEEKTKQVFHGLCTLKFNEICKSVIILLNSPPEQSSLTTEMSIVGLKLLRKIIELENEDFKTPAADWQTDDYIKFERKIKFRQNQLCDLGIVEMIGSIISSHRETDLRNEAILVGIALLLGGNEKAQIAFYDYMKSDLNNTFIVQIYKMIEKDFSSIKKSMDFHNKRTVNLILEERGISEEKSPFEIVLDNEHHHANSHEDMLEKDAILHCIRAFRLLQLFCEGHYGEMQDHLREQKLGGYAHGRSLNFIKFSALKFGQIIKFLNIYCHTLASQILEFLIEAIQGPCIENQLTLTKESKIVDFIKDLLSMFLTDFDYIKRGFEDQEQRDEVQDLVTNSTKLLYSLIEGNLDSTILLYLNKSLEFDFLFSIIVDSFKRQLEISKIPLKADPVKITFSFHEPTFPPLLENAFSIYILIRTLAENLEGVESNAKILLEKPRTELAEKAAEGFFKANTCSIEVNFQNKLHRIFFPILPVTRYISSNSRNNLMEEVNRDSPNDKITGLLTAIPQFFAEMKHSLKLSSYGFLVTTDRMNFVRDLSTIMAFAIIIVMLIFYKRDLNFLTTVIAPVEDNIYNAILGMGLFQIITSALMLVFWLILNLKLIMDRKWRTFNKKICLTQYDKIFEEKIKTLDIINPKDIDPSLSFYILKTQGPHSKYFKHGKEKKNFGHNYIKMIYYWICIRFLVEDGSFQYKVFYVVVAIMGVSVSPLFYTFHLLDICNRFKNLRNVIKSITRNSKNLLLTLFLGVIIVYVFSVIGFFFLANFFWHESDGDVFKENFCANMIMCYLNTLNYVASYIISGFQIWWRNF